MVCNPFCCFGSIRSGAKWVAIIDIILFFVTIVLAIGLEWSLFDSTPMRLPSLFDDETSQEHEHFEESAIMEASSRSSKGQDQMGHGMVGKAIWVIITDAIQSAREINMGLGYLFYMSFLIAMMSYFILEIWLCCILIRIATENRVQFCTKWFVGRSLVLIATLAMTGINLLQMQYTITDIIFQPLNLFRLYSIFVVIQLRKKLLKMEPKLSY